MTLRRIKLYGERNCGTNYLEQLVGRNLGCTMLRGTLPRIYRAALGWSEAARDAYFRVTFAHNLGWKHAVAGQVSDLQDLPIVDDRLLFLTLAKNPYSWLLSLHRRPYQGQPIAGFGEFIERPWKTVGREAGPPSFANPVEMWNVKNRSYLHLASGLPALTLRYEDLLADPEETIGRIVARGIPSNGGFAPVQEATRGWIPTRGTRTTTSTT